MPTYPSRLKSARAALKLFTRDCGRFKPSMDAICFLSMGLALASSHLLNLFSVSSWLRLPISTLLDNIKGMLNVAAENNFRENLRAVLQSREISQSELAERADTSRPYVNRVLNGETVPGLGQSERLANAVGLDLRDLLLEPKIFFNSLLTSVTK